MTAPIARRSVLLVEDDLLQAQSTAFVLKDAGAEVIGPFSNMDEALAALDRTPAQCAVLDLDLGHGMDPAPAQQLRAQGVPVVLLTGYDVGRLPDALASFALVEKPFPPSALLEAVRRVLPVDGAAPAPANTWMTASQRHVLERASQVPVVGHERPFRSAAQLDVSPVICGRLVTMNLLERQRLEQRTEDGSRTVYRITQSGLAALPRP